MQNQMTYFFDRIHNIPFYTPIAYILIINDIFKLFYTFVHLSFNLLNASHLCDIKFFILDGNSAYDFPL